MKLPAKKSLGQHFLNSPSVLAKIISAAEIKKGETVLEIGPGQGILTDALRLTEANVISIEKDDRAINLLNEKFAPEIKSGQITVVHEDILEMDMASLGFKNGEYSVIANIPYYITGAILQKFLENEPRPSRMVLLVQKEVADRICARPLGPPRSPFVSLRESRETRRGLRASNSKESILSISVKAFGTPRKIANVPRGAFTPAPTVDSAILAISDISDKRFRDTGIEIPRFFELVRAGFAHKRKFLIRNLEAIVSQNELKKVWEQLGLDEKVRAEDIGVEEWVLLAKNLKYQTT